MVKIDVTSTRPTNPIGVLAVLKRWPFGCSQKRASTIATSTAAGMAERCYFGPAGWHRWQHENRRMGKANRVEIRRYQADADLQNAEPWVQQLYQASEGYQPCAVVSLGDGIEIIPIQDDLLEELEKLR